MSWILKQVVDLARGDIAGGAIPAALLAQGDAGAHVWQITVMDGDSPADLSGYAAFARFERADGFMREIRGSVAGNVATVTLDASAYAVAGGLRGRVCIAKDRQRITLAEAVFDVRAEMGGNMALTLSELLYYADEGRIAWDGADFFDVSATTAAETDVRDGKSFRRADGALVEGDASFTATFSGTVTATLISGEDYALVIS